MIVTTGSVAGGVLGALTADLVQAHRYNNPDLANLDLAYVPLFGALFALGGYRFARWIAAVREGDQRKPIGREGLACMASVLLRIGTAAIGVRLGFEAGLWTALILDSLQSGDYFVAEGCLTFSNVWIVTGALWSGVLGLIGLTLAKRIPTAASFLGAYLALDAVRPVGSRVVDLYWGTYTSGDQVALVAWIADLISIGILVPCFAAVAYWSARSLTVACTTAGIAAGAALGAWIGFEVQAFYYNDLEWRVLEEVLFFLLGGLGALAGRALGRWIAALRAGLRALPAARDWTALLSGSLLRIAMAGVGLWLGAEAGYWVALLWDEYASAAPFAYGEIALAWIVAGCAIGGALAVLGYRAGHRAPVAAAFLGALLTFAVAPHLAPLQEHLYWGPFPSSDVHAELWRQQFAATSSLVLAMAGLGYVSARWMQHRGAMVGG